MKLDDLLSQTYHLDLRGQRAEGVDRLKSFIKDDPLLLAAAEAKLQLLNELIIARGENACAYSAKYRTYLQDILA